MDVMKQSCFCCGRYLDACRWFYEVLVLSNKGLVNLQQDESYGDISVRPDLAGMARV